MDQDLEFTGWSIEGDDIEMHMWLEAERDIHHPSRHCPCDPVHELSIDDAELWLHYEVNPKW